MDNNLIFYIILFHMKGDKNDHDKVIQNTLTIYIMLIMNDL